MTFVTFISLVDMGFIIVEVQHGTGRHSEYPRYLKKSWDSRDLTGSAACCLLCKTCSGNLNRSETRSFGQFISRLLTRTPYSWRRTSRRRFQRIVAQFYESSHMCVRYLLCEAISWRIAISHSLNKILEAYHNRFQ